jgi:DNA replication licensing factor MCM4
MSSPPVEFPSSDADMDGAADQSMPEAPAPHSLFFPETPTAAGTQQPLFLDGTPSAAGTPTRARGNVPATPASGHVARRALGMAATPRQPRTPLFSGGKRDLARLDATFAHSS